MKEHELKTWPIPFQAVLDGTKRHEIRVDDRDFREGDVLHLREYDARDVLIEETMNLGPRGYTGRELRVRVLFKSRGGTWGLPPNLCVLSIEPCTPPPQPARGEGE